MKYGKIDAAAHKLTVIESGSWDSAKMMCGLKPLETDHGTIRHMEGEGGIGIVVAEYGLFEPPLNQHYFAIGANLYAGDAMLFAYDGAGETIDFDDRELPIRWFATAQEVERAIAMGEIARPAIRFNGATMWQWPDPPAPGTRR